jgi:hypothetical protein
MTDRRVGSDDSNERIEDAQFWIRVRLVSLAGGVLMLVLSWFSPLVSDRPGAQFLFVVVTTPVLMVAGWCWYRFRRRRAGSAAERVRLPWEQ